MRKPFWLLHWSSAPTLHKIIKRKICTVQGRPIWYISKIHSNLALIFYISDFLSLGSLRGDNPASGEAFILGRALPARTTPSNPNILLPCCHCDNKLEKELDWKVNNCYDLQLMTMQVIDDIMIMYGIEWFYGSGFLSDQVANFSRRAAEMKTSIFASLLPLGIRRSP